VPDHLEAARHVIGRLGHLVADFAPRGAATGAGARRGMPQIRSGQDVAAVGVVPASVLRPRSRLPRRCRRQPFRLVGLQTLRRQLELLGVMRQLLRGTAELRPPVTSQLEFGRAISASAVSVSCAIPAMMRFSAAGSSGRLSGAIGTPAVDQICRSAGTLNHWLGQFASACRQIKLSRLDPAATFAAASANRSPQATSPIAPGSGRPCPPQPAATGIGCAPGA
jgi:hypothetical protein